MSTWRLSALVLLMMGPTAALRAQTSEPFDLAAKGLPANFTGDSIAMVADSLRVPSRGEFETSEQYAARLAGLRPARTYAFWVERDLYRKYDADRKVLKIQAPATSCSVIGTAPNCQTPSLLITSISTNRSYIGTNAFGAKTSVSEINTTHYAVFTYSTMLSLDLETRAIEPDAAQAIKETIGMLVIVGPNPKAPRDIVADGAEHSNATFSSPTDLRQRYVYLDLPIVGAWLVNRPTGEVLRKYVFNRPQQ